MLQHSISIVVMLLAALIYSGLKCQRYVKETILEIFIILSWISIVLWMIFGKMALHIYGYDFLTSTVCGNFNRY